jgi:hypothetical protein
MRAPAKPALCTSVECVLISSVAWRLYVCPVRLEQGAQTILAYFSLEFALSFRDGATIAPLQ